MQSLFLLLLSCTVALAQYRIYRSLCRIHLPSGMVQTFDGPKIERTLPTCFSTVLIGNCKDSELDVTWNPDQTVTMGKEEKEVKKGRALVVGNYTVRYEKSAIVITMPEEWQGKVCGYCKEKGWIEPPCNEGEGIENEEQQGF